MRNFKDEIQIIPEIVSISQQEVLKQIGRTVLNLTISSVFHRNLLSAKGKKYMTFLYQVDFFQNILPSLDFTRTN